ncbi:hypothetical protein BGX27_006966 [Mortierella sp. AM989]|nr:hypothetical protein BGX27_006966 [Mortierella sp. AM989]
MAKTPKSSQQHAPGKVGTQTEPHHESMSKSKNSSNMQAESMSSQDQQPSSGAIHWSSHKQQHGSHRNRKHGRKREYSQTGVESDDDIEVAELHTGFNDNDNNANNHNRKKRHRGYNNDNDDDNNELVNAAASTSNSTVPPAATTKAIVYTSQPSKKKCKHIIRIYKGAFLSQANKTDHILTHLGGIIRSRMPKPRIRGNIRDRVQGPRVTYYHDRDIKEALAQDSGESSSGGTEISDKDDESDSSDDTEDSEEGDESDLSADTEDSEEGDESDLSAEEQRRSRRAKSKEGLKDETLLELFSKHIKTGLPRGKSSNYKKILRNQLPENIWFNQLDEKNPVNIQRMWFQERKPYRSVDYNHRYDWMHPKAALRVTNRSLQDRMNYLKAVVNQKFTFVNYFSDKCCYDCVNKELEIDPDIDYGCPRKVRRMVRLDFGDGSFAVVSEDRIGGLFVDDDIEEDSCPECVAQKNAIDSASEIAGSECEEENNEHEEEGNEHEEEESNEHEEEGKEHEEEGKEHEEEGKEHEEEDKEMNLDVLCSNGCTVTDPDDDLPIMTCPKCLNPILIMSDRRKFLQEKVEEAKKELAELEKGKRLDENPVIFQSRCHWCGIKLPHVVNYTNFLAFARVDIEGVGSLPCIYEFDHEQKRLCLHCAAECGALLKEKRRFQSLYELSSRALPRGCNNCGIRESVEFRPSFDRTGETCIVCSEFKLREGLDPDPPGFTETDADYLSAAIIEHTDQGGIHWDRVVNNPFANPQFDFTAHGLLNRWVHSRKTPDAPALSTYILLQHNHLTRRSQDWELYTCTARSPTQAALYFARFVALYKKRPMTYLYIRQLEEWNIPEPRGDEWEDLSSGLQTFEQLKDRIRRSILQSLPKSPQEESTGVDPTSTTENEAPPLNVIHELYEEDRDYAVERKIMDGTIQNTVDQFKKGYDGYDDRPYKEDKNRSYRLLRWKSRAITEFGPRNRKMLEMLHWCKSEDIRDFREYRMITRLIKSNIFGREDLSHRARGRFKKDQPPKSGPTRSDTIIRAHLVFEKLLKLIRDKLGYIQGVTGLVPLDPPEYRERDLPVWAQRNARDIVEKTVADNRMLYIYQQHLQYLEYQTKMLRSPSTRRIKEMAAKIQQFALESGHALRTSQDCQQLAREILLKDNVHFIKRSKQYSRMANGEFIKIVTERAGSKQRYKYDGITPGPKNKFFPLANPFKMLRPNTLRLIAGPRPDIKDDPIQRIFLEAIMEIDRHRILQSRPAAAVSRDIFYEDKFQDRPTFAKREDLPSPWDNRWNPSREYPVYLLPPEYQVHVFQSVLTPETRTVDIRLVRTERYKRQGDCVQGGGPVAVPKVIDRDALRGFYRESNRTERRNPDRTDLGRNAPEPTIVLKGKTEKSKQMESLASDFGIEVWEKATSKDLDDLEGKKIDRGKRESRIRSRSRGENQGQTLPELIQQQQLLHQRSDTLSELRWVDGVPYKVSYEPCADETPIVKSTQLVREAIRETRDRTSAVKPLFLLGTLVGTRRALGMLKMYPEKQALTERLPKYYDDLNPPIWSAQDVPPHWHWLNERRILAIEKRGGRNTELKEGKNAGPIEGEASDEEMEPMNERFKPEVPDFETFVREMPESEDIIKEREDEERAFKLSELIGRERDKYLTLRQWYGTKPDWTQDKFKYAGHWRADEVDPPMSLYKPYRPRSEQKEEKEEEEEEEEKEEQIFPKKNVRGHKKPRKRKDEVNISKSLDEANGGGAGEQILTIKRKYTRKKRVDKGKGKATIPLDDNQGENEEETDFSKVKPRSKKLKDKGKGSAIITLEEDQGEGVGLQATVPVRRKKTVDKGKGKATTPLQDDQGEKASSSKSKPKGRASNDKGKGKATVSLEKDHGEGARIQTVPIKAKNIRKKPVDRGKGKSTIPLEDNQVDIQREGASSSKGKTKSKKSKDKSKGKAMDAPEERSEVDGGSILLEEV